MYHNNIDQFERAAEKLMPALFKSRLRKWEREEDYQHCAEYAMPAPLAKQTVMEILREERNGLQLMYSAIPSLATTYKHSFCFYSDPMQGDMLKINGVTRADGKVDALYVTIYESIDDMRLDLVAELQRVEAAHPAELTRRSERDFDSDFIF